MANEIPGDRPLIESIPPLLRDEAKAAGELGLSMQAPARRHLAAGKEDAGCGRILRQMRLRMGPVEMRRVGDGIAVLGKIDGRPQQLAKILRPVIGAEARPGIDRAGNGDRMRAVGGYRAHAALVKQIRARGRGGKARSVIGRHALAAGRRIEREGVAADADVMGLGDAKHGGSPDGGVHGIAARAQDLDRRQGRQRIRRRDHGIAGIDGGSPRELEVAHVNEPSRLKLRSARR